MELGCLQSPLTTSLAMPGNLWEVGEGTWEGEDSDLPAGEQTGDP